MFLLRKFLFEAFFIFLHWSIVDADNTWENLAVIEYSGHFFPYEINQANQIM